MLDFEYSDWTDSQICSLRRPQLREEKQIEDI